VVRKVQKRSLGKNFEGVQIQPTLTVPIYSQSLLLSILNIYSTVKDVSDKDGMKTKEYIRYNIVIAVADHMTVIFSCY